MTVPNLTTGGKHEESDAADALFSLFLSPGAGKFVLKSPPTIPLFSLDSSADDLGPFVPSSPFVSPVKQQQNMFSNEANSSVASSLPVEGLQSLLSSRSQASDSSSNKFQSLLAAVEQQVKYLPEPAYSNNISATTVAIPPNGNTRRSRRGRSASVTFNTKGNADVLDGERYKPVNVRAIHRITPMGYIENTRGTRRNRSGSRQTANRSRLNSMFSNKTYQTARSHKSLKSEPITRKIRTSSVSTSVSAHSGKDHKRIGAYTADERWMKVQKYLEKRKRRTWTKRIKYDVRKTFADSRMRVKGRFISKEDEGALMEGLLVFY